MASEQPDPEEAAIYLPDFLKMRRERLGYLDDEGIIQMAEAAAVPPGRWREFEAGDAAPAPDELPRIALALVNAGASGDDDDPGAVLGIMRAAIAHIS
jgi:hypothetical protein